MSIRRRDFLSSFGAASFAAALPLTKGEMDALAAPPQAASPWDVTWVDRIKGKYRAVFDSPGFSDGAALFRSIIWARQYKEVFGAHGLQHSDVPGAGMVYAINSQVCRFAYEAVITQEAGWEDLIAEYSEVSPVHEAIPIPLAKGMATIHRHVFGTRRPKPKWKDD